MLDMQLKECRVIYYPCSTIVSFKNTPAMLSALIIFIGKTYFWVLFYTFISNLFKSYANDAKHADHYFFSVFLIISDNHKSLQSCFLSLFFSPDKQFQHLCLLTSLKNSICKQGCLHSIAFVQIPPSKFLIQFSINFLTNFCDSFDF